MGAHFKQNYSPLSSPLRIRTVEESLLHKKLCMDTGYTTVASVFFYV